MLISGILAFYVNLFFGALPESAAVLLFGTCLIASTIGIRKLFKYQDQASAEDYSEKKGK